MSDTFMTIMITHFLGVDDDVEDGFGGCGESHHGSRTTQDWFMEKKPFEPILIEIATTIFAAKSPPVL